MFDFSFGVGDPPTIGLDTTLASETIGKVQEWLASKPTAEAVTTHLPALELAFFAYVTNQNSELLADAKGTLERVNASGQFEGLANATLADVILLNLRVGPLVGGQANKLAAARAIATVLGRWDDELEYFKANSTDASHMLNVRANAKLGEALYFAWRALDDAELRPKAGEILGQVSAAFTANAALYATDEEPVLQYEAEREIGTYAAAIEFFLTASETTGRGTYATRARIVADTAKEVERAPVAAQVAFAKALLRLEHFTSEAAYGRQAREILGRATMDLRPRVENADVALAISIAENFPLHVAVVGDVENDENTKALWFAAMNVYAPTWAIEVLHPTQHATRLEQLGYRASSESALAYICIGTLCLPAVRSVTELEAAVRRARSNA